MYQPVRWRWGLAGLVLAIVYVLADLLFEWRGPVYQPWVGDEQIMGNVIQMMTGISLITLVAFALGYAKDARRMRGK